MTASTRSRGVLSHRSHGPGHLARARPGRDGDRCSGGPSGAVPRKLDGDLEIARVDVEGVLAGAPVRDVVALDPVSRRDAEILTPACLDDVRSRVATHRVTAWSALDVVDPRAARDEVGPAAGIQLVVAPAAVDPIVASVAEDHVVARKADDRVVPEDPQMTSSSGVPRRTSLSIVPTIVHSRSDSADGTVGGGDVA